MREPDRELSETASEPGADVIAKEAADLEIGGRPRQYDVVVEPHERDRPFDFELDLEHVVDEPRITAGLLDGTTNRGRGAHDVVDRTDIAQDQTPRRLE